MTKVLQLYMLLTYFNHCGTRNVQDLSSSCEIHFTLFRWAFII